MTKGKATLIAVALWMAATFSSGASEKFDAMIYRQGSEREELLFLFSNEIIEERNSETLVHRYFTPDGTLFAEEKVIKRGEDSFIHSTSFLPWDEYSHLEYGGESLNISFRRGNEEKEKEIDYREGLLFGPTQQTFIKDNLDDLLQGKKIAFMLPVPEFTTTAEFSFQKVTGSDYEKPGHTVIEMSAENLFIRLIIGSNYFVIDNETGLIREIHGPSLLREKKGGKWKPVNVDILFSYE